MDRDEISNLYRGPAIDASYQVSVHLAEGFQRRRLKCEELMDDGRQVMAKAHLAFDLKKGCLAQSPTITNSLIGRYSSTIAVTAPRPFHTGWHQVLFTHLKWPLVPPDFKECCIRYS
jgi:hypothetical protein